MANDRSIPEKYKGKSIWSYSRLNNYLTCPYGYKLQYIDKLKGKDNIYSSIGSIVHEICEGLQKQEITNEQALILFKSKYEELQIMGIDFFRDQERINFIYSISDYLKTYKHLDYNKFQIEHKEFLEIDDSNVLLMFIDLVVKIDDNKIGVYDYKTSSKYTKDDIAVNGRQLVLYAYSLLKKFSKYKEVEIAWFMLKYVNVTYNNRTKQTSRHALVTENKDRIFKELAKLNLDEIEVNEIFLEAVTTNKIPEIIKDKFIVEDCVIYHTYTTETVNDMLNFISSTIKAIQSDTEFKPVDITEKNKFFCEVLCGQSQNCKHLQSYQSSAEDVKTFDMEGELF